mgnify:CR=1 FL=1
MLDDLRDCLLRDHLHDDRDRLLHDGDESLPLEDARRFVADVLELF